MLIVKRLASGDEAGTIANNFYRVLLKLDRDDVPELILRGHRADIMAKAANYKNFLEFKNSLQSDLPQDVKYLVFYYSDIYAEVREFPLTLRMEHDREMTATSKGYHKSAYLVELKGTVKLIDRCLNIYLESGSSHFVHLYLHAINYLDETTGLLPQSTMLQGVLLANSFLGYGNPVSMECILIREDRTEINDNIVHAKRYLNLKRNAFEVKAEPAKDRSAQSLMVMPQRSIGNFNYLANLSYRVWMYEEEVAEKEGSDNVFVLQARFKIDGELHATIEIPRRTARYEWASEILVCRIVLDRVDTSCLHISTFRENVMTSFAILANVKCREGEIVKGGLYAAPERGQSIPKVNYFAMMLDSGEFAVERLSSPEVKLMARRSPDLSDLKSILDSIALPSQHRM